jgi:dipeptidase
MDLLRVGLERATDAAQAVSVMVDLLERHGQGGGCSYERPGFTYHNSFLVADRNGAIVLETAGTRWATEEVKSDARSISNGLTIGGFAEAYADRLRDRVTACRSRRQLTEAAAQQANGPARLMSALRDHGPDGTVRWSLVNGSLHAPCVHAGGLVASSQTTASLVSDLRGRPIHWATATAAPCTSLFKPVSVGEPVDLGPEPTNRRDGGSLWWRHERLHRATMVNPAGLLPRYRHARDRTEAAWIADPPSAADAFAAATTLEQAWFDDLGDTDHLGDTGDERPYFVRRLWRSLEAAAGGSEGP